MAYESQYGIRNVPVFVVEVRHNLGFTRETLSRYLGVTPLDLVRIESGRTIPRRMVLSRLIWFHRFNPILTFLATSIGKFGHYSSKFTRILYCKLVRNPGLRLTGRMTSTGQLKLPLQSK